MHFYSDSELTISVFTSVCKRVLIGFDSHELSDISKTKELAKFWISRQTADSHGVLVECRLLSDDDVNEGWRSSLYTLSHNLRISASRPFHSGIILIAASSFGSFVFGLLHWGTAQNTHHNSTSLPSKTVVPCQNKIILKNFSVLF